MKKNYLTLAIIFVLLVGFGLTTMSTQSLTTVSLLVEEPYHTADIDWSDNFDDGNMDGWVTHEWQGYTPNYTVIDGVVYSQGENYMNIAGHDSSVVFGTWSFDVYINRPTGVEIMETSAVGTGYSQDGYEVIFDPESNTIRLEELYATSDTTWASNLLDTYHLHPLGWHHVDVTRDTTGYFCVYLNGTPYLEAIDLTVTTSNVFIFAFAGAFDNVVVSDTVDIDEVAPYFLQDPNDQVIAYGEDFNYKLNATDFSGVVTWELNDTSHFAISDDGLITNVADLQVGVYGLDVTVADDDLYRRTVSFSIIVEATTTFDLAILVVTGGAITVVVLIVLVMYLKKRS